MKYITILPLATFAVGVIAESVAVEPPTKVRRDLAAVTNVISAVQSGLSALDTSVKRFSGQAASLMSAASSAVDTINSGTTTVDGSSDLFLTDALGLQTPVKNLQTVGDSLSSSLIGKKSDFESAGLCDTVGTQANNLQTASNNLIKAIVSKIPSSAQSIAQSLAAPLEADLANTVAAFPSGNCSNSGGSSR